jgi:hypothetical protein
MPKTSKRETDQVKTVPVSARTIMARKAFRLGFEDQRAGRKPRYDEEQSTNDSWDYERGRQFAIVAPAKMLVMTDMSDGRVAAAVMAITIVPSVKPEGSG